MTTLLPARVRLPRPDAALARPTGARVTVVDEAGEGLGPFRSTRGRREMTVVLWPYRAALWGGLLLTTLWAAIAWAAMVDQDSRGALCAAGLAVATAWLSWKAWLLRVRITASDERLLVEADGRPLSLPMSAVAGFEVEDDLAMRGPRYRLIATSPDGETPLLELPSAETLQWLRQTLEQRGRGR